AGVCRGRPARSGASAPGRGGPGGAAPCGRGRRTRSCWSLFRREGRARHLLFYFLAAPWRRGGEAHGDTPPCFSREGTMSKHLDIAGGTGLVDPRYTVPGPTSP